MKVVGYFDGTDSRYLTRWVLRGYGTLPVSNGADGHGTYVSQLSSHDVQVVVGWLHKIVPPQSPKWRNMRPNDLLYPLKAAQVPCVIIVDEEDKALAEEYLKDADADVTFANPDEVAEKVLEILG
jgi:hypothetical protein